ncbi:2-C-methyl-D-erythritol 4-phosphate cytidylyltransferase [bacterium]|nr:2-C-methyl-D-erythritol 4-phosphate cytidylyltransferase [bacterium]
MPSAVALLVAAGSSRRFGGDTSKTLLPLGGKPLFLWSLEALEDSPSISAILIAVRAEDRPGYSAVLARFPATKFRPPLVLGGETRSHSVRNLLAALAGSPPELVLIHDAARPFPSRPGIDAVVAAAAEAGCATFAAPVTDTLSRSNDQALLCERVPREGLWAVQTPQAFRYDLLVDAYRRWPADAAAPTDETTVMYAAGHPARCIVSGTDNLKITHPADFALAEALLAARTRPASPPSPEGQA